MIGGRGTSLQDLEKLLPNDGVLSIAAIAEMPFPLSMVAMRRYYCKDWHKPEPDGETPGKWSVRVRYSYTETETDIISVEATTQEEAEELAQVQFEQRHKWDDYDIVEVEAELEELVS